MSDPTPPTRPGDARAAARAAKRERKATRPWWKKKRYVLPIAFLVLAAFGSATGGGNDPKPAAAPAATTTATRTTTPRPVTPPPSSSAPAPPPARTSSPAAPPPPPKSAASKAPPPVVRASVGDPARACDNRPPATGDILLREVWPHQQPVTQGLGGQWRWDYADHKCLSSIDMNIATAPTGPGYCTQVALASDNPGYPVDAVPAPPLKKVAAAVGCG